MKNDGTRGHESSARLPRKPNRPGVPRCSEPTASALQLLQALPAPVYSSARRSAEGRQPFPARVRAECRVRDPAAETAGAMAFHRDERRARPAVAIAGRWPGASARHSTACPARAPPCGSSAAESAGRPPVNRRDSPAAAPVPVRRSVRSAGRRLPRCTGILAPTRRPYGGARTRLRTASKKTVLPRPSRSELRLTKRPRTAPNPGRPSPAAASNEGYGMSYFCAIFSPCDA